MSWILAPEVGQWMKSVLFSRLGYTWRPKVTEENKRWVNRGEHLKVFQTHLSFCFCMWCHIWCHSTTGWSSIHPSDQQNVVPVSGVHQSPQWFQTSLNVNIEYRVWNTSFQYVSSLRHVQHSPAEHSSQRFLLLKSALQMKFITIIINQSSLLSKYL